MECGGFSWKGKYFMESCPGNKGQNEAKTTSDNVWGVSHPNVMRKFVHIKT